MTENEYVNKQTILDAIKSTKPEPSEYMDMTDNIAVNVIILGAAVKQYEDIVKIVEAAKPTERKPVVHGRWVYSDEILCMPQCTNCGAHPFKGYIPSLEEVKREYKFCPSCGAKMIESESEDNA